MITMIYSWGVLILVSWCFRKSSMAFVMVSSDRISTPPPTTTATATDTMSPLSSRKCPTCRPRLTFPLRMATTSSDEEEMEEYLQDPKFLERTKRWIVIVDDEEPIRLAVGDFLYDRGYQVTACADADSMLRLCSTSDQVTIPDAIIR